MAVSSSLSPTLSLPPSPFQSPSRPSVSLPAVQSLRRAAIVVSASSVAPRPRSVAAFVAAEALEAAPEDLDGGGDLFEVGTPGSSPLAVDSDYDALVLGRGYNNSTVEKGDLQRHQACITCQNSDLVQVQSSQKEGSLVSKQRIIIENRFGEKLVSILYETGSNNLVILCHGFRSSKESKTLVNLAAALTKEGISVVCFDFSGNRESEGSFQYGNYRKEVDDLHAIIRYYSGLKSTISAIVGHSKGGDVVLLYASMYHDIHTVVNISGRFYLHRGIEARLGEGFLERIRNDKFIDVKDKSGQVQYRVTEESLMDRLNTDMHQACLLINKDCRILTVHGSADEIVPAEDALELAKLIPNHRLKIIEGADHLFRSHHVAGFDFG